MLLARRQPLLDETAEAMVHRNCVIPVWLCHHFAPPMVSRGVRRGTAGRTTRQGVDVIGLILGKTDSPSLRTLEHKRGGLPSTDAPPMQPPPRKW
ncbi:MAG: hypothetical protein U5N53_29050 [Mycobacterium sp.]|nr:hypothetical protein [Mycobacterium sp.]